MSRKEASAALVGFVMEGIMAERDVMSLADSRALHGSSAAFSHQLWKSVGLTPKLMGDRREQFLVEQGIGVVPPPSEALRREGLDDVPPPVTVVCGSSRSARAVQRACRQRFSAYTDSDKRRSPKDMKAAAIAEFESQIEKRDKLLKSPSDERLASGTAAKTSAKRPVSKERPKPSGSPIKAAAKEEAAGGAVRSTFVGIKRVSDSATESHADAAADSSPGLCLHCMEKLGARPLLSCFECKTVMHFDCYANWAGAEPGPWDNVHCPAHKPVKKPRHRPGGSACTSPRAGGVSRKPSMDLEKKLSVLADGRPEAQKDAPISPTTPLAGHTTTSPTSSDMTHNTHHSPARSERQEPTHHAKLDQVVLSPKTAVKRPQLPMLGGAKLDDDEELAMRLHRELNAAPTRRRRGDA